LLIVSACASRHLDYEMGSSVKQMIDKQVYNPEAVNNPPKGIVAGMDGGAAENVINSYRKVGSQKQESAGDAEFTMKGN
ncbi:hypothetical protein JYU12_02945, partial [bacterium AH-315-K03]|nr:hypothetical protein [bacterium AH-315-K03]